MTDITPVESTVEPTVEPTEPSQSVERTPREKAEYNLRKRAEEAKALGVDPAEVLGIQKPTQVNDELPDDKPLTIKDLRDLQKQDARKTAMQMAEDIADSTERDAILSELRFIVPSGDADADFRRAQASANAERNALVATEAARKGETRRTAAGGSAGIHVEDEFVPTAEESRMMKPPYNLSKEKIIASRPK
jgi:hypothetical protein